MKIRVAPDYLEMSKRLMKYAKYPHTERIQRVLSGMDKYELRDMADRYISKINDMEEMLARYEKVIASLSTKVVALLEVAQSVIDEAKDGIDRSAWRLEAARKAIAKVAEEAS